MGEKRRLAREDALAEHAMLADRLIGRLVEAATDAHMMSGPGVLYVRCDSGSLSWMYKVVGECAEEASEWAELRGLLSHYDPEAEVIVALLDGGAEFFRLPVAHSSRTAKRARQ